MRLHQITLEGFRGFVRKETISLDADVIICHGPNGAGKTSLLDGILWALSGRLDRFANGSPVSLYAKEGVARVELTLRLDDRLVGVTRVTDGKKDHIKLADGEGVLEGAQAEAHLINLILPHLSDRTDAAGAVCRILTRGVYLQQDLIREFIDSDTAAERFSLISEIIGAGVVIDLQNELERSRRAWSMTTNSARREKLQPLQAQLSRVQETISRLETTRQLPSPDVRGEAEAVFRDAVQLLGTSRLGVQIPPTSASELDRLLKDLTAQRIGLEREFSTIRALIDELKTVRTTSLDEMRKALAEAEKAEADALAEVRNVEAQVGVEIERLQTERQKQISSADQAKRLAAMAQVALTELGEVCPVCTQPYDRHVTENHLRALIDQVSKFSGSETDDGKLNQLRARGTEATAKANDLRKRVADLRRPLLELEAQQTLIRTRLADIGIDDLENAESLLNDRAAHDAA
jgi:DNA repair exonuclease SbcCD ATPase subunit